MENLTWKPGKADEPWKVAICKRDAGRAADLMSGMAYILSQYPGRTMEEQASTISRFTGKEIADAIRSYWERSQESIRRGEKQNASR